MTQKMVTIPASEYKELLNDQRWLECLQDAGVDNWEGYEYAKDLYNDLDEGLE